MISGLEGVVKSIDMCPARTPDQPVRSCPELLAIPSDPVSCIVLV